MIWICQVVLSPVSMSLVGFIIQVNEFSFRNLTKVVRIQGEIFTIETGPHVFGNRKSQTNLYKWVGLKYCYESDLVYVSIVS